MKIVASVFLACSCALLLAAGSARAQDPFAEYRIPEHSWTWWTGGLSASGRQSTREGSYEAKEGSWGADLTSDFEWAHDAEAFLRWLDVSVRGTTTAGTAELSAGPTVEERLRAVQGYQDWFVGTGGRAYPWASAVGLELDLSAFGSYRQQWQRTDYRQLPDPSFRIEQRSLRRFDQYQTLLQASLGAVLGRVRDATVVYDVHVLEQRLQETGAIAAPLPVRARERVAALLTVAPRLGVAHDRPARFLWREVERVLREEGALADGKLDAFAVLRATERTSPRSRFQRLRGRLVGPMFTAETGNLVERGVAEEDARIYLDDSLVNEGHSRPAIPDTRIPTDRYWAGARAQLHQPLGWAWQLDLETQVARPVRTHETGFRTTSRASIGWDIADRWAAQAAFLHQREHVVSRYESNPLPWAVLAMATVAYFLEDRTSVSLSLIEQQVRQPAGDYSRQRQAQLGLTYRFLGALDAPGLMEPVRPLR